MEEINDVFDQMRAGEIVRLEFKGTLVGYFDEAEYPRRTWSVSLCAVSRPGHFSISIARRAPLMSGVRLLLAL